jgi:6-phosphogluconolactonase (cycloisomerase 2 family)/PKD repeat protein
VALVPCASASRVLYAAAGSPANQIYGFGLASDGGATWLGGFPLQNQTAPAGLAVGANAGTLYAALSGGARPYAIDATSGALTAGTVVAAGTTPAAVAVSPSGGQLYVANSGSDSITRLQITADGSLSSLLTSTKANGVGTAPDGLAMTPDGRFLYVADAATGKISAYSVSSVTGDLTELTPDSTFDAGTTTSAPAGLTMAASGAYLYAALRGDDKVAGWSIDGATGALTPLAGSPYDAGDGPTGIAIAPDGTRLLVANAGDGTIGRYLITAGAPSPLPVATAPVVAGADSVAISPNGNHAYVGGASSVAAFDLSATGGLTAHGTPQPTGVAHSALAITPDLGPTARVNPVAAPATTASRFQGGPSLDSDGKVAKWSWSFGDGTTGDGDTVSHVYANPGTYTVQLTVTDDEGCSAAFVYTGQQLSCVPSGFSSWSQVISVPPAPDTTVPPQECQHDGDDGFCGTPDRKAPITTVLGFNDGASITTLDAPTEIVGSITPDPSGIQSVKLRFSKAAGTIFAKKTVRKKVCHTKKVKGKKHRTCKKQKVVVQTKTKVPACLTVSGTKNYLVKYACSKVPWVSIGGDSIFRYDLPVALGIGSYTVDVVAADGAGNTDVLEAGRNHMTFKIIATPSNSGGDGGDTTTTPTTTTTTPVNDTGSPFGH